MCAKKKETKEQKVPQRYKVRKDGDTTFIICLEAPSISVYIHRGKTVSAADSYKAKNGTVFLDGASAAPPFLNNQNRVYNLDHHEQCVRPFTLSTCEQALLLILKGMSFKEHHWRLIVNEPDLDAILAVWLILNSDYIRPNNSKIRRQIIPLVRIEGLIDVQGLDLLDFSGMTTRQLNSQLDIIHALREEETGYKKRGTWQQLEWHNYTVNILGKLDQILHNVDNFQNFHEINELARIQLTSKRYAVVSRAEGGIYELESQINRLYGDGVVAVIIMQKDKRNYTLRLNDPFLHDDLTRAYDFLNTVDPAVNGYDKNNIWNGSGEIGGSPRSSGTQLQVTDIIRAVQWAFLKPTLYMSIKTVSLSIFAVLAAVLTGWGLVIFHRYILTPDNPLLPFSPSLDFSIGLLSVLFPLYSIFSHQFFRVSGLRIPGGWDWLFIAPLVIIGAVIGGSWFPVVTTYSLPYPLHTLLIFLMPAAASILFHGFLQGILSTRFSTQYVGGPWTLSLPTLITALTYTACHIFFLNIMSLPYPHLTSDVSPLLLLMIVFGGAFLVGFGGAILRERSQSILPPMIFHMVGNVVLQYIR